MDKFEQIYDDFLSFRISTIGIKHIIVFSYVKNRSLKTPLNVSLSSNNKLSRIILIKTALALVKLKENLELKKDHIIYFLHQFANMDYNDLECQKQLIKTFINSVFVYDDKVVLTFNYSGDNRTITLMEIDAGWCCRKFCDSSSTAHFFGLSGLALYPYGMLVVSRSPRSPFALLTARILRLVSFAKNSLVHFV